jgi:serine/threonine protein kinase
MPAPNGLEDLLAECVSLQMEGRPEAVEALMRRSPQEAEVLREGLQAVREAESLLEATGGRPASVPAGAAVSLLEKAFDDYEVLGVLGQGSAGTVALARQKRLDRLVALKVLNLSYSLRPTALERFEKEGRLLARLDHRNIISVHAVGHHPDVGAYIVMPYIRGVSLGEVSAFFKGHPRSSLRRRDVLSFVRRRILQKEMSLQRLVAPDLPVLTGEDQPFLPFMAGLLSQVAEALSVVHQAGLIHRDIKPSNILLSWDGVPFLLDFGLTSEGEQQRLTASGMLLGTPLYSPPENFYGGDVADPRSDIYSLGVTSYELLTGRLPFEGRSLGETLRLIEAGDPARPCSLNADIDPGLESIVLRCIEKKPSRRYSSAAGLLEDLEKWRSGAASFLQREERSFFYKMGMLSLCFLVFFVGAWVLFHPANRPVEVTANGAIPSGSVKPPPLPAAPPRPPVSVVRSSEPGPLLLPKDLAGSVESVVEPEVPPAEQPFLFTDPEGSFSFVLPAGWVPLMEDKIRKVYSFRSPDGRGVLTVRIHQNPHGLSLDEILRSYHNLSLWRLETVSLQHDRRSGFPSVLWECVSTGKKKVLRNILLFLDRGETTTVITGYSTEDVYASFQPLFLQSMDSFQPLPLAPPPQEN